MNLKIREGNTNDYIAISTLVKEIHDLHVLNIPDVYLNVDNPFKKEQFEELLNSNNTNLFVKVSLLTSYPGYWAETADNSYSPPKPQ